MGAAHGSWEGHPGAAGAPPALGELTPPSDNGLSLPTLQPGPKGFSLPPRLSVLTKALYRIILTMFRC